MHINTHMHARTLTHSRTHTYTHTYTHTQHTHTHIYACTRAGPAPPRELQAAPNHTHARSHTHPSTHARSQGLLHLVNRRLLPPHADLSPALVGGEHGAVRAWPAPLYPHHAQFVRPLPTPALEGSMAGGQHFQMDLLTPAERPHVVVRLPCCFCVCVRVCVCARARAYVRVY